MMECSVLPEIGPENVECISHISVLGTVPAIVPGIPELPATVPELFLEMIHCNFTKMYFRPSVNKGSSRQLPYTTIVKKVTAFCSLRVHINTFPITLFPMATQAKLSSQNTREERENSREVSRTKLWGDQTVSISPQYSLLHQTEDCHGGPKPHTRIFSSAPAQSETTSA
jgi:hypothetical protein